MLSKNVRDASPADLEFVPKHRKYIYIYVCVYVAPSQQNIRLGVINLHLVVAR
jgi:hypothetical protein